MAKPATAILLEQRLATDRNVPHADVWSAGLPALFAALESPADPRLGGKIRARLRLTGQDDPRLDGYDPVAPNAAVPVVLNVGEDMEIGFLAFRKSNIVVTGDPVQADPDFADAIRAARASLRRRYRVFGTLTPHFDSPSRPDSVRGSSIGPAALVAAVLATGIANIPGGLYLDSEHEYDPDRDVFPWVPLGAWNPRREGLLPLEPEVLTKKMTAARRAGFRHFLVVGDRHDAIGKLATGLAQELGAYPPEFVPENIDDALQVVVHAFVGARDRAYFESLRETVEIADSIAHHSARAHPTSRAELARLAQHPFSRSVLAQAAHCLQHPEWQVDQGPFWWDDKPNLNVLNELGIEAFGPIPSRFGKRRDYFARVLSVDPRMYATQHHRADAVGYIGVLPLTERATGHYLRGLVSQFEWTERDLKPHDAGTCHTVYVQALYIRDENRDHTAAALRIALLEICERVAKLLPDDWCPGRAPHPRILAEGTTPAGKRLLARTGWNRIGTSALANPIFEFRLDNHERSWPANLQPTPDTRFGHLRLAFGIGWLPRRPATAPRHAPVRSRPHREQGGATALSAEP